MDRQEQESGSKLPELSKNRTRQEACIHCKNCQRHCEFLTKYHLDIGDPRVKDLAYHCFLCGKCYAVCPRGIDGRQLLLEQRISDCKTGRSHLKSVGYRFLLWEKESYRFRNTKNLTAGSVLFPGCNFPSFYPETTRYLAEKLYREKGIGTLLDCCKKPVDELGLEKETAEQLTNLDNLLASENIQEIIVLCPNCYSFLKPKLTVKVVSIYEKLTEWGWGQKVSQNRLFLPCPDREKKEMLKQIRPFLANPEEIIQSVQCCGMGGCASIREPELAFQLRRKVGKEPLSTYCATCSGNFVRGGCKDASHLLVEILGRKEQADTRHSLWNRARLKYYRLKKVPDMEKIRTANRDRHQSRKEIEGKNEKERRGLCIRGMQSQTEHEA